MADTNPSTWNVRRIAITVAAILALGAIGWQLLATWLAGRRVERGREEGAALMAQGRFTEGEAQYAQALDAARELGPQDPRLDQALNDLAEARIAQGKTEEIVFLRLQAVQTRIERFGPVSPQTARAYEALGEIQNLRSDSLNAEGAYNLAIDVWNQLNVSNEPDVVPSYLGRATAYEAQGKLDKAEADLKLALTIQEKATGANSPETLPALRALARIVRARGDQQVADALDRRIAGIEPPQDTPIPADAPGS